MNYIREMEISDISQVLKIENECFSTPWSQAAFLNELDNPNTYYYVLCDEKKVIGYAGFWKILEDANITNIAISKNDRNKGYGQKLMAFLMEISKKLGIIGLTLEVREGNKAAIAVYKKYGFKVAGIRKEYYTKPIENALIMWAETKKEDFFDENGTKSN